MLKENIRKVTKKLGAWDLKNAILPVEPPKVVVKPPRIVSQTISSSQLSINDENEPSGSTNERESLFIAVTEQGAGKSCLVVKSKFWAKINYIDVSLDSHALWDIILLLVLKEAQLVGKSFDKHESGDCYFVDKYV